jgi:type II secretory pathway component PulK
MKGKQHRDEGGFALLAALGLLIVFVMLGTAWLGYMFNEGEATEHELDNLRATYFARGAAQAAIGEIETALASGTINDLLESGELAPLDFPVYTGVNDDKTGLEADPKIHGTGTVTISDECARVNLNHAPTKVLMKLLGVRGDAARRIRANLPRSDDGEAVALTTSGRAWLTSVDDLTSRGLVDAEVFNAAVPEHLTVYSVSDPSNPAAYLNVNTAPKPVLEAVLDLTPEQAENVLNARPFSSVDALAAAAGKSPDTFNVRPAADAPGSLPKELCFESRCFRINCTGAFEKTLGDQKDTVAEARIVAVVLFEPGKEPEIRLWNEAPQEPN